MNYCDDVTLRVPMMQDRKVLTLRWSSFSGWGTEHVAFVFPQRWSIPHLWMSATNPQLDYPRCKAKNHWHSIDTHFQNGAVKVTLALVAIMAANTLVMHNSDQITLQLPYLQFNKSWILCWPWLWYISLSPSIAIDNCIHNFLNLSVAFLTEWDSAHWKSWAW